MATSVYLVKSGLYSQVFLENLAMCVHLELVSPAELRIMQSKMSTTAIEKHLGEIILANAPAYRARAERQAEKA